MGVEVKMPIVNKSLFKIEKIDLVNGSCEVRFINPHGPIETKQKQLSDFVEIIDVPTGSFELDGTPITKKMQINTNDNPNDDIIWAIDIPLDENEQYIDSEKLVEYISKQYPHEFFERKRKTILASKNENIKSLEKQEFEINLTYPDPQEIDGDVDLIVSGMLNENYQQIFSNVRIAHAPKTNASNVSYEEI
jgi:hypothetical protein